VRKLSQYTSLSYSPDLFEQTDDPLIPDECRSLRPLLLQDPTGSSYFFLPISLEMGGVAAPELKTLLRFFALAASDTSFATSAYSPTSEISSSSYASFLFLAQSRLSIALFAGNARFLLDNLRKLR
jgi:hypothetical protein